jgi:hypothetical protein
MLTSLSFSQDTIVPRGLKKSPYRKLQSEPYQFFKFKKFERHFDLVEIDKSLDSLDKKAKSVWNLKDSIILFSNLAKIKDYDKAYDLYKKITHNRFMLDDYGIAKDLIYTFKHKDRPDLSLRVVDTCLHLGFTDTLSHYWMRSIHEARQNKAVDWRWLIDNNIFEFPVDTILPRRKRNDQFYKDSIIVPLDKLDAILKDEVLYTPEKDVIIAEVFYEIGAYLENVGSNTQAYIAYSLGKIYNGNDFKSAKRIRVVKDRLIKKKYRIPSVRKFFPKYKKGRFSYEVIKQRIIKQKMDSVVREPLPTMIPVVKKDLAPKFPKLLLIMGGIFLLLIFVLIFVKTKKK